MMSDTFHITRSNLLQENIDECSFKVILNYILALQLQTETQHLFKVTSILSSAVSSV